MAVSTDTLICLTLGIAVLAGCNRSEPARPASAPQPVVESPPPPPPPPGVPQAPKTVREKADVGVGAKGRDYGLGPVTTPVATYFAARERITFDIQIPHTMNLFKATEGRAPKTQEEFMQKIIKEGQINLPQLPPGHRYLYDPKTEQLMVEQPAP